MKQIDTAGFDGRVATWRLDEVQAGIKEFDEGRSAPHHKVTVWLRSWDTKRERKPRPGDCRLVAATDRLEVSRGLPWPEEMALGVLKRLRRSQRQHESARFMNPETPRANIDDARPKYDFSRGKRGVHHEAYRAGTNVVFVEPDQVDAFPNSASVNRALRLLVKLSRSKAVTAGKAASLSWQPLSASR